MKKIIEKQLDLIDEIQFWVENEMLKLENRPQPLRHKAFYDMNNYLRELKIIILKKEK